MCQTNANNLCYRAGPNQSSSTIGYMPSDCELKLLEVLGIWLAGLATFSAVLVSLWLARTSNAEEVDLSVYHSLKISPGVKATPEFITFAITNLGPRSVTICNIGWRSGLFRYGPCKAVHAVQLPDGDPSNSEMPCTLGDGDMARYLVPLDIGNEPFFVHFARKVLPTTLHRWTLKAEVYTSRGNTFRTQPNQGFFDRMDKDLTNNK